MRKTLTHDEREQEIITELTRAYIAAIEETCLNAKELRDHCICKVFTSDNNHNNDQNFFFTVTQIEEIADSMKCFDN